MGLIETEALILKTYNLADADKIVIFLTKEAGLIKAVAKGAKRLKSKFGSSLEPFSIVQLSCFQKEHSDLLSLRQIELKKSFFSTASQISLLEKFAYLSDLLLNFAPPHDPNKRLYKMARICFETASKSFNSIDSLIFYFEFWILELGGFLPSWDFCRICKKKIITEGYYPLQYNFQISCNNCQKGKNNLIISPVQRRIYTLAKSKSPESFIKLTQNQVKEIKELSSILKRIIAQVLGKDIKKTDLVG